MHYILLTVNWALMILMPIGLGWIIATKRDQRWGLFAVGGATFVLSQIAHVPFNRILFSSISDYIESLPATASLLVIAILAGLSAGLFEESARYLAYRYWAKDARTRSSGLMLGAGHGGAESIILGVLAALNIGFLMFFKSGRLTTLIPEDQHSVIFEAIAQIVEQPWYELLLGAIERAFALSIQLALSLMVLQAFLRKQKWWLLIAVGFHAMVDATAVIAASFITPVQVELIIGVFGIISILVVYILKTPEPSEPRLQPVPDPLTGSLVMKVTPENIENSRYN